jgi:hypothetical protein
MKVASLASLMSAGILSQTARVPTHAVRSIRSAPFSTRSRRTTSSRLVNLTATSRPQHPRDIVEQLCEHLQRLDVLERRESMRIVRGKRTADEA